MGFFMMTALFVVIGLVLFEVISSIDNAVINAEVLNTMSAKARNGFFFGEYSLQYLLYEVCFLG
jgi:hypothetical protein